MEPSADLIDFDIIEGHKENIQALPSGRSAKALAQLYSPPLLGAQPSPGQIEDAHSKERAKFEQELVNIDEADDPLDVYDRYVRWTMNTYPSAQATPQSRLLPLLERATKTFQSSQHYKNDPRYLKLWLQYIALFSDAPREVFVFLARHGIGSGLALYYEEFAAWLENAGRWNQAEEIYHMGIEEGARPVERLVRKFGEFQQRKEARPQDLAEPSSPALPAARPALAAKMDPFAASSPDAPSQQHARSTATRKTKSAKMAIFADQGDSDRPSSGSSSKGWDSIGSLAERKKENTIEAKPWAGEKLKTGKTNGGMQKMMIFKDQSTKRLLPQHIYETLTGKSSDQQCAVNPKTGRLECVYVNLEAIYPRHERVRTELCFEELRMRRRGWLGKDWRSTATRGTDIADDLANATLLDLGSVPQSTSKEVQDHVDRPRSKGFTIFEDDVSSAVGQKKVESRTVQDLDRSHRVISLNDENDENAPPRKDIDAAKKARREERANRTRKIKVMDVKHIKNETRTIQINLDSPTGPRLKKKKHADKAEPTMTINTKEAMDEIYGIFNQPLQSEIATAEAEDVSSSSDDDSEDDDDCSTTGDESTATGKLSGPASEYGDETRNELFQQDQRDDTVDGATNVTGWSDFTTSKHVPQEARDASSDGTPSETGDDEDDEPMLPGEENPRTRYIPVPPEGYEPLVGQFRDMAVIANNRLPFMTPIVEQTESSLSGYTGRRSDAEFSVIKTPSRNMGAFETLMEDDDELCSSPFNETMMDMTEDRKRVLQPIRTKSTKGTLSLGSGPAKSQVATKTQVVDDLETVTKGPAIKDDHCNPMDPYLRQCILARLKPSLSTYEGYYEDLETTSGRGVEVKKYIKLQSKAKANPEKVAPVGVPPAISFGIPENEYTILRELGAGTFAPVYLAENDVIAALDREDEGKEQVEPRVGKDAHRKALEAIKMEEPPSTWEFYIIRQSHRRLGITRAAESIVRAHEMHLFRDECFLIEEYRDQGTLLDLVNIARADSSNGGGMDEMLAMFFTVELLRTVEALHAKQLIHGDLKGDNILVRFDDPGMETDWSPTYFPSGAHGWSSKGVCLIDFGRGIDMKQFIPNVGFIADWKTTDADCAEMRELRPWTYQIDYYGLAGIVHSLLFGKYMETIAEKTGSLGHGSTKTYRIREGLKRYWQTDIWTELFGLLLNPLTRVELEDDKKMPLLRNMRSCRERMEAWLEENCDRGIGLKGMVVRMESAVRERRRKFGR